MISTSCITGTGFMKCIPITCAGRLVRAAISVMEIELVFDARIAPASGEPVELRKDLELEVGVFGGGLDGERRAFHCAEVAAARGQVAERGIARRGVD